MPLGQGIEEWWDAVQDRVEVAGHGATWEVTAGSFESALAYARARFDDPVVLARKDRDRWWPRVTLTVTTDPGLAAAAPPLAEVARPAVPAQPTPAAAADTTTRPQRPAREPLPSSLEAFFSEQNDR